MTVRTLSRVVECRCDNCRVVFVGDRQPDGWQIVTIWHGAGVVGSVHSGNATYVDLCAECAQAVADALQRRRDLPRPA